MIAYVGLEGATSQFASRVERASKLRKIWPKLDGALVSIVAAGALAACSPPVPSTPANVAASYTPEERARIEAAATAEAETAANAAEAAIGSTSRPSPTKVSSSHEYQSREGNVFYYAADDGTLVGVADLGRLPANQDFSGHMKRGDRAVQLDGGQFAALTPGSTVVRVVVNLPGEQVLRPRATVPLSGNTIAAMAMRDSLAGNLVYPSQAALAAQDTNGTANQAAVVAAPSSSYQGYVPEGFATEGMGFPGKTGAQILRCTEKGMKASDLGLSKEATRSWFSMCAKANPANAAFIAGNCTAQQTTPACRQAIEADKTVRAKDDFWWLVNAMEGRPDDYGLD